jgi:hypothetical protein
MEESKNKNGPLNVIRLLDLEESDYRALDALSYSRLSDIERVGINAVNAKALDIGKLRGVNLGSIIDDVISNRRTEIPSNVQRVKKMPTAGSSTYNIAHLIVDNLKFYKFQGIRSEQIVDLCTKHNMFTNGVTVSNVYSKMENYAEYIDKVNETQNSTTVNIITDYDYLIAKKAIERLRRLDIFDAYFPKHPIVGSNSRHIEYQMMLLSTINGIEFKCMLDAVLFDHKSKQIWPIDIKTGALSKDSFSDFIEECYCYYNYYIQAGIYRKILIEYFKYHPVYKDYSVEEFRFIYSTTNPKHAMKIDNAFTFIISQEEYLNSFKGFRVPNWSSTNKNTKEQKPGIADLFNFYKANVVNPSTRKDLMIEIESRQSANLPF